MQNILESQINEETRLQQVKNMVESDPSCLDAGDWTPLIYAVFYNRPEVVRYLLFECKVDPDRPLRMGATPVFVAAEHGRNECLKLLHQAGANAELAVPSSGTTPLIKAAEGGHMQELKYLINEMKVDIDKAQSDNATPFFMACQNNKVEIVRWMLTKGVDADKGKLDSATPIIVAAELGHTEVVRALIYEGKIASAHTQMYNGVTPLYKACEKGHLEIVKILCEGAKVDPDLPKNDGVSPLFTACQMGHLPIIKYLAEHHNADINKAKNDGVTPLYMAAEYRNVDIVKYLIARGANLDQQSMNGLAALHAACIQHVPETVQLLINANANINLQDNAGFSPICNASEWGREAVLTVLLEASADVNVSGWNGNTALHIAAWKGKSQICELLLEHKSSNIDINRQNNYGYTPLHLAALAGNAFIVNLFLDKADLSIQNCQGDTPLHSAVQGGNRECIQKIATHNTLNPNLTNLLGMNARDMYTNLYPQETHSALEAKVQLSNVKEVIPAAIFADTAKKVMEFVSLENVKLIRRNSLIEAGCIPHYAVCEKAKWHCDGRDVRLSDKVLFVSHRWGDITYPDPTNEQYNLVIEYLDQYGADIEFIWADYSCICQDRESKLFGIHLQNIPTSVWTSTHCLIIPKLMPSPYNNNPQKIVPTTHLTDYLGRAWCLLEAMAALLTGSKCHLAFQVGSESCFEEFDRPEGACTHLGFFMSYVKVWNRLFAIQQPDMMNVDLNVLETQWRSKEPCAIMGKLITISKSKDPPVQCMLQKALQLSLTLADLDENVPEIKDLWESMGECSFPEDKMVVLNLMLFIGFYSMNLFHTPELVGVEAIQVEVSPAMMADVNNELQCTQGHPLKPSTDRHDFICDGCKCTGLITSPQSLSCAICDYDLCPDCKEHRLPRREEMTLEVGKLESAGPDLPKTSVQAPVRIESQVNAAKPAVTNNPSPPAQDSPIVDDKAAKKGCDCAVS